MHKITSKSWKDGSVVKVTDRSSRENRFNSQQLYSGSQPSLTPVQRNTTHSSGLCRHRMSLRYMYSCACKTSVHIKMGIYLNYHSIGTSKIRLLFTKWRLPSWDARIFFSVTLYSSPAMNYFILSLPILLFPEDFSTPFYHLSFHCI